METAYEEFCFAVTRQGATAQELQELHAQTAKYEQENQTHPETALYFKTEREALERVLKEFFQIDMSQN